MSLIINKAYNILTYIITELNYIEDYIKLKKHTLTNHNFIRALIFPPFQLPIVNGIAVKKSIFKKKKIILLKK